MLYIETKTNKFLYNNILTELKELEKTDWKPRLFSDFASSIIDFNYRAFHQAELLV